MARAMTVSPQPESMFASGGGAASAPPLAVAPAPVSYPHEGVVSLKTQGSSDKFRERELLQQSLLRVKNYFTNDGKQVLVQVGRPVTLGTSCERRGCLWASAATLVLIAMPLA
eukprot:scaffold6237_cov336-Prasinococcus_capsulatus_cf.AAC.3